MSAIGWVMIAKQFKLSHKPGVAGLNCGGWQYNKRNFTLLYAYKVCDGENLQKISLQQATVENLSQLIKLIRIENTSSHHKRY